ncbi:MAG: Rrf2 family transcriptional regulator [Candidatus Nitrotoga sp.]|nr:Rrf2 family transcriptional regulator [Candidatus Nitrotoga sp.]MBP0125936.1 Rrf2 family transcriptional regulator [Candidatus Nitrotoga sp.]
MQLTKFTDYSLRTLLYLGEHPDELITIKEISDYYGIVHSHLTKVVHLLSTSGYVHGVRGRNGGIRLAKPPQDIMIGAVVRATEENLFVLECFDPKKQFCRLLPGCKLKNGINAAYKAFFSVLDNVSLKDVIRTPGSAQ